MSAEMRAEASARLAALPAALQGGVADPVPQQLQRLVDAGLAELPLPGAGQTLLRWQALALVGGHDLSLAKLYEGHTDALAILRELGASSKPPRGATWGVWAAEAPGARVTLASLDDGRVRLQGTKQWCSGAASCSHALLTAWWADGRGPQLVQLALAQSGVAVSAHAWQAVGMHDSASIDVRLDGAVGHAVGSPGEYLSRPGFWHGGAGVAACWHGGAVALAQALHDALQPDTEAARGFPRLAALGRVDVALRANAALLREAAAWIDQHPQADASAMALRVRLCTEASATAVLGEVGRALGAAPFCRDARFARLAADLPVFLRQSHGERDLAALGERARAAGTAAWQP